MYGKVFTQIFDSSIMSEDLEVRYVWMSLISLADKDGEIDMTINAISRRICLEEEKVEKAIQVLSSPDKNSRSKECEGRRLVNLHGSFGWKLVNYTFYRDIKTQEDKREYMREYMRKYRELQEPVNKKVNKNLQDLTVKPCKPCKDIQIQIQNTDINTNNIYSSDFEEFWKEYPRRGNETRFECLKSYEKAMKRIKHEELMKAVVLYKKTKVVKDGYAKMATTWLNQRGWENDNYKEAQQPSIWENWKGKEQGFD